MQKTIIGVLCVFLFVGALAIPAVHAETTTDTQMAQIKALMAQLEELQKQMNTIKGEVRNILKSSTITEGTTSDDVKKIQELLATDETVYPEGKVTGYFGPMTKEALKRFQKRHNLSETGMVDGDTKEYLESYLKEGFGENVPKGLLKAPGMMKKVESRMETGCGEKGKNAGMGPLCKKIKERMHTKEDGVRCDHEHKMEMRKDGKMKDGMKMKCKMDHKHEDMMDDEDEDDEMDDDNNSDATFKDATKAIRDASREIMKAQKEIRKAEGDTAEAQKLLKDARAKQEEALAARVAKTFDEAVESAEMAGELAEEAAESAKDADEDDEEEDEDEDEDDSDDEDAEDDN